MNFDPVAAEAAAEDGMDKARRAFRVQQWKEAANEWLATRDRGVVFTADSLVAVVGLPDVGPARNNVVGAWVSAQSKMGRIVFTGRLKKSERVERHGNLQRVWRVAETGATLATGDGAAGGSSAPVSGASAPSLAGAPGPVPQQVHSPEGDRGERSPSQLTLELPARLRED